MPTCSIIIPVYNHAALTRQCLDTLLAQPPRGVDCEIIVVDDGSRDATRGLLAGYRDRVRVITHAANAGFATTCNDGAAAAAGEFLVFLNNDTVPTPGWLDALADYAGSHPAAAAVGSRLLFPDGTVQHAGVIIGQDRSPWHIYSGFPGDHPAVTKSRRFQVVTGACVLVRRAAFDEVGGFDPAFHNGLEDVDLCLRLGERGHEIHYCHKSVVYHLESLTRGYEDAGADENARLYRRRWGHRVRPDDVEYYLEDGLISFGYPMYFPVYMTVDPLLAIINQEDRGLRTAHLLQTRARQVMDLLRDNVRLKSRLREAESPARDGAAVETLSAPLEPGEARPVEIIIPVYGGLEALREAVASVTAHTDLSLHTLTLIDDASPDPRVRDYLHDLRQRGGGNLRVLLNEKNLGFPATANRGMRLASGDVLLLNSDAVVTARWVEKLQRAAYSDPRVASVTPFSNNATICSVPRFNEDNPVPAGHTVDSFAALVERVSVRRYPELPTAHGFCVYLKRDALNAVGLFDELRFASGYGEENDWCMRASRRGLIHILDDATYVFHRGSASFTNEVRERVVAEHLRILDRLYPNYLPMIGEFLATNPLRQLHARINAALGGPLGQAAGQASRAEAGPP